MHNSMIRPRKSINNNKKIFSVSESVINLKENGSSNDNKIKNYFLNNSSDAVINNNNKKMKFCEQVNEYLMNSSLHGLKYIGDPLLSTFEKIFFTCSFIIVFTMSGYFISNIYEKWSDTPVIIGLNPTATSLKDIPFPAVTICNMNQAKKSVAKYLNEGTLEYSLLESLCANDQVFNTSSSYQGKWSSFRGFLLNVTQPCTELLVYCRYAMETRVCTNIFNSVLTDEGICCSFNSVDPKFMFNTFNKSEELGENSDVEKNIGINWTPENGFPENMTRNMFPRPVAGAGNHLGLTVILDAQVNDYYCSSTSGAGFKILLHNPTETPKIAHYGFFVQPGTETQVSVTPRISDASNLIRKISKDLRQCIFANEGNLSYFKTYSKKNCEMECESRLTEAACGCVQYFMPRNTEETNICSRKESACYAEIKTAIDLSNNQTFSCTCLPGCHEISYTKDISVARLGDGSFEIKEEYLSLMDNKYVQKNIALLHIYFHESAFRSFTKGELIGFTEFLSNTGGLLGLFMGFSVLSLIEIIYFISLRPYFVWKRMQIIKSGNREDLLFKSKFQYSPVKKSNKIKETFNEKYTYVRDRIRNIGGIIIRQPNYDRSRTTTPTFPYYN